MINDSSRWFRKLKMINNLSRKIENELKTRNNLVELSFDRHRCRKNLEDVRVGLEILVMLAINVCRVIGDND